MQAIETAWKQWFGQFAPYIFTEGELVQDPTNTLYPRITFSYAMSDFFVNTLTTFQVWSWSHNNAELWKVCNKIANAVPVEAGTTIIIPSEIYHEYRNPDTGQWLIFDLSEFQAIADEFAPAFIEWRRVEKKSAGELTIWRGSPFLTPSPKDEQLSRVMYGTLQARYRTTK